MKIKSTLAAVLVACGVTAGVAGAAATAISVTADSTSTCAVDGGAAAPCAGSYTVAAGHTLTIATPAVTPPPPPPPPPGSHTVPAAPTGPATPAGGWSVVYGDAFGSCLAAGTNCTAGYARSDTTLGAESHKNGAGNSNEIDGLVPAAVDVKPDGLYLHCASASSLPNPYGNVDTCGAVSGGAFTSAPGAFHWTPTGSTHFVVEGSFQVPANQGNMDPSLWINGPKDVPEVDNPELWGWSHPVPAGATNTWSGYMFGDPAVPFDVGATGNVQLTFGKSPVATVDPSSGFHTWTLDMNGDTFTSYLDGVKIGTKTYTGFNGAAASFKMLLMSSMRVDKLTGKDYPLPAGGNDLIFHYVAVYAPASQGSAGTNGPIIVPGTSVQ